MTAVTSARHVVVPLLSTTETDRVCHVVLNQRNVQLRAPCMCVTVGTLWLAVTSVCMH